MPLRNYGLVKGTLTGVEHIAVNHTTGKPAHLIFFVHTPDGEKQCAFNVFSVNNSSVFLHVEHDLLHHKNEFLKQLASFASTASSKMYQRDSNELPDSHCVDYVDLEVGFPHNFNQEDSNIIIQHFNQLFEAEMHELHNTTGRQSVKGHEVAVYGQLFDDKTGIHQVHMNSYAAGPHSPSHSAHTPHDVHHGPHQDGILLLHVGGGHWKAVFVAFDTQIRSFVSQPHEQHADAHQTYHANVTSGVTKPHAVMHESHPTFAAHAAWAQHVTTNTTTANIAKVNNSNDAPQKKSTTAHASSSSSSK